MLVDELNALKGEIIGFAVHVESMIDSSIKGIRIRNQEILQKVILEDEPKADDLEVSIDRLCTGLIAQYEPKAKDLRTILMILKMNNDLERVADLAYNISESGLSLLKKPEMEEFEDYEIIYNEPGEMFKDSIEAFIEEDAELAKQVLVKDEEADLKNMENIRKMIAIMRNNPDTVKHCMQYIRISKNLERIADLSTNICEDVFFMVEGEIIKHTFD